MASNGNGLSDSKQTTDIREGTAEPLTGLPDTARKLLTPGNKPHPPIPKKPPVSQKPPNPHTIHHDSQTALHPGNPHSACTSPASPSQLSSCANHPLDHDPASATAPENDTGSRPAGKRPPPPLPKNPPKGPPSGAGRCRAPPPKQKKLPPAKPPVPVKRPATRTPEKKETQVDLPVEGNEQYSVSELTRNDQLSAREQTYPYDQVIVEENSGLSRGEANSRSGTQVQTPSIPPKEGSYQQVIVQRDINSLNTSDTNPSICVQDGLTVEPKQQPESYENIVPDNTYRNTTVNSRNNDGERLDDYRAQGARLHLTHSSIGSTSQHSYDKIIVEENSQVNPTHLHPGASVKKRKEACISRPSRPTRTVDRGDSSAESLHSPQLAAHGGVKNIVNQGEISSTDISVLTEQNHAEHIAPYKSGNDSCTKSESGSSFSLKSPKENCPPKSPPPVRPKPKKRFSLQKQTLTTEHNDPLRQDLQSVAENLNDNKNSGSEGSEKLVGQSCLFTYKEDIVERVRSQSPEDNSHSTDDISSKTSCSNIPATNSVKHSISEKASDHDESSLQPDVSHEAIYQEIDELELPSVGIKPLTNNALTISNSSIFASQAGANQKESSRITNEKNQSRDESLNGKNKISAIKENICSSKGASANITVHPSPRSSSRTDSVSCSEVQPAIQSDRTSVDSGSDQVTEATVKEQCKESRSSSEREPVSIDDVEETSCMLKEIEQLLTARGVGLAESETAGDGDPASSGVNTPVNNFSSHEDNPLRPPRPRRADKLRKLTVTGCSLDSSSTESLNTVGLSSSGKKAPPKPKRQHVPHRDTTSVTRSSSDVTGMKHYISQLSQETENEDKLKPFLPPRLESLRLRTASEPQPPPLPPRNKSMERIPQDPVPSPPGSRAQSSRVSGAKSSEVEINVGQGTLGRSTSGLIKGKNMPRPTRPAPPPPVHPPHCRAPKSSEGQGSGDSDSAHNCESSKSTDSSFMSFGENSDNDRSTKTASSGGRQSYQKIVSGSSPLDSLMLDTVKPEIGVVSSIDNPHQADVSIDNDYHEISDQSVAEVSVSGTSHTTETENGSSSKEDTPPPDLPPRSYQPPSMTVSPQVVISPLQPQPVDPVAAARALLESARRDSLQMAEKESKSESCDSGLVMECDGSSSLATLSLLSSQIDTSITSASSLSQDDAGKLSQSDQMLGSAAEDSTSQCSQQESFSSEVLGSLRHVVGESISRPVSTHSS